MNAKKIDRRWLVKAAGKVALWTAPVVEVVSLPVHAMTSGCSMLSIAGAWRFSRGMNPAQDVILNSDGTGTVFSGIPDAADRINWSLTGSSFAMSLTGGFPSDPGPSPNPTPPTEATFSGIIDVSCRRVIGTRNENGIGFVLERA